ncbi:MAG: LCP family protein [Clostridia bacterium]|nr:LCP family protein [Clostridia bacterium]
MSEYKTTTTKRKQKKKSSKLPKIILGILIFILLLICAGLITVKVLFHLSKDDPSVPSEFIDVVPDDEFTTENAGDKSAFDIISEMQGDADLSSILKDWATNSTENSIMYQENVINFLLMGIDATGGNSDVIMMVTLNDNTKKIYLTSFMRDSYTYIQAPNGSSYAKVNAAYGNGGAACLVQTIENDYKIRIDHYVSVNFSSFSAIVDAIGGVSVPVKQYEAEAMGNLGTWGDNVKLNGEQALMYCRIRYCDSDGDVSRTRRQRQFINALIDRCKELSVSQLTDVVSMLMPYVKTDCSAGKIISLGTKALVNRWYEYETVSLTMPAPDFRMDYLGNAWVWIVDYPAAAQYLQTTIYGETNIKLNADRLTAIDVMRRRQTGTAHP